MIGISVMKAQTFITSGRDVWRTLSNIYDGAFCKNNLSLKVFSYFRKRLNHRSIFEMVLNTLLCSTWSLTKGFLVKINTCMLSIFKGALSGLRQFLATECPLKMMKNAFYLTPKALFVLKLIKFLSWLFGHISKRLD